MFPINWYEHFRSFTEKDLLLFVLGFSLELIIPALFAVATLYIGAIKLLRTRQG